jgi:rubrerythrin
MLQSRRKEDASFPLEQAQSLFEALNADLVATTRALLDSIVSDDERHPKLLNTLSLLEHIGSRKIMATQHGATIDKATLRHLAEECHHAFFMKRQAEKAAARQLRYDAADLLAAPAARMYFQRLEVAMNRELDTTGRTRAIYLYMSMIVELRAIWFYEMFQQALTRAGRAISLKRLLGEEQSHLAAMAASLTEIGELDDARVESFVTTERMLFGRLLASLERSLG